MHQKDTLIIIFLLTCTAIVVFLAIFIVTIVVRYQRKHAAYIRSVEELKISHENEMLLTQIEIQEQTFANIAREIHDNVGQKLSLAKLYLVNAQSNKPPIQELEDATNVITIAIDDLRGMSRIMSADMILHNGFKNALEEEITKINKLGSYIATIHINGEAIFMEGKKELMLFRIVQEALQNIIKHAGASKIIIELFYEPNSLFLNINDNGKGFDANNIDSKGQGIMNMKKRTAILNGVFEIQSSPQNGTAFKIKIPTND